MKTIGVWTVQAKGVFEAEPVEETIGEIMEYWDSDLAVEPEKEPRESSNGNAGLQSVELPEQEWKGKKEDLKRGKMFSSGRADFNTWNWSWIHVATQRTQNKHSNKQNHNNRKKY